jgi:cell division protein FtsW
MWKRSKPETMGPPDWLLVSATLSLLALGLMMVYSSSCDLGYRDFGDPAYFFKRQLVWLALGTVAMLVTSRMHYRHWMKLSIPLMAAALFTLSALIIFDEGRLLIGRSVSPVEPAKLAMVVYLAHWLASKPGEQLRRLPYGLLPFAIIVGLVAGLVVAQPDLSEALVIVLISLAMFFLAGADLIQFVFAIAGGSAAFALVITRLPHALERLQPYLVELRDPLHSGNYQLSQGIIALGSGGIFGLGPGSGRMKYQWLPAAHTDSIFAIMGEELGLVGCMVFIGLLALVAYRGLRISDRAPDSFGRLLAIGVTCWITFQSLINMAVVTGTMPFTGIALPFVSVGGSSLVTCMLAVGITVSVSRAANAVHSESGARRRSSNLEPGTLR